MPTVIYIGANGYFGTVWPTSAYDVAQLPDEVFTGMPDSHAESPRIFAFVSGSHTDSASEDVVEIAAFYEVMKVNERFVRGQGIVHG